VQRLQRSLTTHRKEEFELLVSTYDGNFDTLGILYNKHLTLYRPKGCQECQNTGYKGRTAIVELLVGTRNMKSLIQGKAKMEKIREQAIEDGMRTLMQDGIRKIFLGQTDLQQVRRVCM